MKKLFYLFAALIAACAFTSCDEKSTPNSGTGNTGGSTDSDPLCGTWILTSYFSASYDGEPFANDKLTKWTGEKTTFIFTEKGECIRTGYFGDGGCQYRHKNSVLELYTSEKSEELVMSLDVISLSNKELVLRMESNYYYHFEKNASNPNGDNPTSPTPEYNDPDQIDLSKYNPQDAPSCWKLHCWTENASATEYIWANEYNVAAAAKVGLTAAKENGITAFYSWTKDSAATEEACKAKNAD